MGILDDAIKEHLELKRQHGAGESELKQLEDEAFGAAERPGDEGSPPDPLAEAPTEFMTHPDAPPEPETGGGGPEAAVPEVEAPPKRAPRAEIADLQEAPPTEPHTPPEEEEPAEEESPAMEHEGVAEPSAAAGPSTEEREAIAEQPTEMYDVEEELTASQPRAPSEEELVEEEMDEPRLAPVDPLSGLDEGDAKGVDETEADDFFDEQRLSDELDQALEAPAELEEDEELEGEDDYEDEGYDEDEEAEVEEPQPGQHHEEDLLEETPDFLEEAPEDDQLWFEQKPPKDFDFDD
jgi:hypothetical protein